MTLSVIIPAYNVEYTLARCAESILGQGLDDMEVILVDDGSTDGTSIFCDQYARRGNVRVIHQKNAGLSEARNTGIKIAKGELITFVDSDDFLEPGTYSPLVKIMSGHPEYDILEYSIVKEDGNRELFRLQLPDREFTSMGEYWIEGRAYAHSYAWNKIYRRQLFGNVLFPKGHKFEDVDTLPRLLMQAHVVRTTRLGLYHYTYNRNGITVKADAEAWRDLLRSHVNIINNNADLRHFGGFADYYAHVLNIQISTYQKSGKTGDIILPVLPYYQTWKLKLLHIIGLQRLCRLFRLKATLLGA